MIRDNVLKVRADIQNACLHSNRDPLGVTLVAVTKTVSIEVIQEALDAGLYDVAENRVQEAESKFPLLTAKNTLLKTHIIGHLQTNKAREAVKYASLIQSVDSLKLAGEIEKHAVKLGKFQDILVQFNTAHEEQKFGADPKEAQALIEQISHLSHINIRGLMCMAPYTEDQGVIRKTFADLRVIRDLIKSSFNGHARVDMGILSMGMSSDYKIAIEEGSTMIRVGSAIFNAK